MVENTSGINKLWQSKTMGERPQCGWTCTYVSDIKCQIHYGPKTRIEPGDRGREPPPSQTGSQHGSQGHKSRGHPCRWGCYWCSVFWEINTWCLLCLLSSLGLLTTVECLWPFPVHGPNIFIASLVCQDKGTHYLLDLLIESLQVSTATVFKFEPTALLASSSQPPSQCTRHLFTPLNEPESSSTFQIPSLCLPINH